MSYLNLNPIKDDLLVEEAAGEAEGADDPVDKIVGTYLFLLI
jgi:hypothetical protein